MEKILQTGEVLKKASQERIKKRDEELKNLKESLMTEYNDKLSSMQKGINLERERNRANKIRLDIILKEMNLEVEIKLVDGKATLISSKKKNLLEKLRGE